MTLPTSESPGECRQARLSPVPERGGFLFEDGLLGINAEITRKGFFGGLPKCSITASCLRGKRRPADGSAAALRGSMTARRRASVTAPFSSCRTAVP